MLLRSGSVDVDDRFDFGSTEEGGVMRAEETVEQFGDWPRHDEEDDDEKPDETAT